MHVILLTFEDEAKDEIEVMDMDVLLAGGAAEMLYVTGELLTPTQKVE